MDTKNSLSRLEAIFFVVIGIFFMVPVLYSGTFINYGLSFWGPNGHDAVFHLALIKSIGTNLNLDNPLLVDTYLKNYHLAFDLISAIVTRFLKLNIYDWYFRISPLLSTFLLIFFVRKVLIKMQYGLSERLISFLLVFFGGSLGFLVSLVKSGNFIGGESAFWINQAASAQLNPPYIWSLVALIAFVYYYSQSNKKYFYIVVPMLLFYLKAYAGILACGVMVIEGIYRYLTTRKTDEFFVGFLSGILLLFAIGLTTGGQSVIVFDPFWFMKNMWSADDRVGILKVSQWWNQWERDGNIKLLFLQVFSLFVFIIGNFGLRLFSIRSLSDIKDNRLIRLLWWLSLLGIAAPILFIQKSTPWNTAQFAYYSLASTAILSGSSIYAWLFNSRRLPEFLIKVFIIFLGTVTSIGTLKDYFSLTPATYVGYYEVDVLSKVANNKSSIVTIPYERSLKNLYGDPKPIFAYESTAYVALIGSRCSLCDEVNLAIMGYEYKNRLNDEKILLGMTENYFKEFVDENSNLLIYVPSFMVNETLFKKNNLKLVSSNQGVSLWKK